MGPPARRAGEGCRLASLVTATRPVPAGARRRLLKSWGFASLPRDWLGSQRFGGPRLGWRPMASRAGDRTRNPPLSLAEGVRPLPPLCADARGGVARGLGRWRVDCAQLGGCRRAPAAGRGCASWALRGPLLSDGRGCSFPVSLGGAFSRGGRSGHALGDLPRGGLGWVGRCPSALGKSPAARG